MLAILGDWVFLSVYIRSRDLSRVDVSRMNATTHMESRRASNWRKLNDDEWALAGNRITKVVL